MTAASDLDAALDHLPERYPGPGGAVAVLRRGEVVGQRSWGFADVERRLPFTAQTLFRICSITKQFTCAAMLDRFPDPSVLDGDVARQLPLLATPAPRTVDLAHNQSGLRDYWASAMLCGAAVEGVFGPEEARALVGRTTSLQFAPGTRSSYCNQNFRLLGDVVAQRTGLEFAQLLRPVFERAGMAGALLAADTQMLPDGTVGYEGTASDGFRPAVNRIHWTGDAGIAASLADMIAWERFIDATRDDPDGLYARLSAPVAFQDGTAARYGFGLGRGRLLGRAVTSHGGGLRGWRSFRCNLPAERVSVVVLFNHMADPFLAATELLSALLGHVSPGQADGSGEAFEGRFIEPETGLLTRLETLPGGRVRLWFGSTPETLDPAGPDVAGTGPTRLRRMSDGVWLERDGDNLRSRLVPLDDAPARRDIEGVFRCDELDAALSIVSAGGVLHGAFSGALGQGLMVALLPAGPDVWRLPCPRALDYSAPGDWTLRFRRDGARRISGVTVGSWLARGLEFQIS
jgi:D-aminopeptidase